jgi:hypothetical protein
MAHTRRTIIAGLAALPAVSAPVAASLDDPIFAAIERHRAALSALENIDEQAEPDAFAEAQEEMGAAYDAMLATVPQTVPGCRALVDHLIDEAGVDLGEALDVLRRALDRLATPA